MNTSTTSVLFNSLEPLFNVCIKQADRHGLDEIRISKARARELHRDILVARKALENPRRNAPGYHSRLDAIYKIS